MYDRIRAMREDRDLRQQDVADLIHCSQVAYSRYELGKRDIPTEVLVQLSRFYGVSVDYLLGLTDMATPYPRKKR